MGVMEQGKQREAGINNVSRLRIQGGLYKNRQVMSPDVYLRPMMGKVKSAVFSTLRSFGLYSAEYGPVRYLDVFAGSGGVGLESLSRSDGVCEGGASDFVDFSEDCKRTIEKNLINLGINEDPNGQRVPNGVLTQTGNRGWAYLADAIGFLRTPEKFGKQVRRAKRAAQRRMRRPAELKSHREPFCSFTRVVQRSPLCSHMCVTHSSPL